MLGLSVLLARLSWLYDTIRLAGAAYLIYLGVRTLWSARSRRVRPGSAMTADLAPPSLPDGLGRAWRVGFLTNIGNPKAAAFFGSLLGALLPAGVGVPLRAVVIMLMVAMAAGWYALVASLFGLPVVARTYQRGRRWIDRATAAVLIALGGRLALDR